MYSDCIHVDGMGKLVGIALDNGGRAGERSGYREWLLMVGLGSVVGYSVWILVVGVGSVVGIATGYKWTGWGAYIS